MIKIKSVVAQIWKLPFWIWLLPAFIMLGWSHWKDVENERIKQRWTTRIGAVNTNLENTELLLKNHEADANKLKAKVSAAKARGGATDAQMRALRAEMARLDSQLVLIDEGSRRSRTLLDKLDEGKAAGLFNFD